MKEFSFWVNDSFKPEGDEMSAVIHSGSFYQFVYFHFLFLNLAWRITGKYTSNVICFDFSFLFVLPNYLATHTALYQLIYLLDYFLNETPCNCKINSIKSIYKMLKFVYLHVQVCLL